jgi:TetR/AcrR family transcriptional repressor of nem operon
VASAQSAGDTGTATRILDVAERLVQTRGFNGFSYADVAAELGVTKPSLHYHFASKTDLGEALIERYAERFAERLEAIDAGGGDAPAKLAAYADIYASVLHDRRMCLCGMLAAEYETLPEPIRAAILGFFDDSEAWLADVLERGQAEGSLSLQASARDEARAIVSSLEGALLVARPFGDVDRFEAAAAGLLRRLAAPAG